jgi:hypothetical protein
MLMIERTANGEKEELLLADREAVDFLSACDGRGVVLRNCPPYVRMWMASRGKQA